MTTYEKSFKIEAVKLAEEIGLKNAANQLNIPYYTLSDWRHRQNIMGEERAFVGSGHKRAKADPNEQRIYELEKENAELRQANEILKDALGFFAASRKK